MHKAEATHLESSVFIGAYFEERLIGFAKLVHDETHTQANLMNILSLTQYRDKCPTNALLAQAVRACAASRHPFSGLPKVRYTARKNRAA